MQKNTKSIIKTMCMNAFFIGIYLIITFIFGDLSFGLNNGIISFRVAEMLIVLCCFDKKYISGAVLACFTANLFNGQVIDIIVGSVQTILTTLILYFVKNKHFSIFLGSLICGMMIGLMIYLLQLSIIGPWIILTTFIGEFVILEIGYLLFKKYYEILNLHN